MAETKKLEFTQREIEIMTASFQGLKSNAEYDFKKIATILDMTNHNSAANAVRSLRKKIESHYYPDGVPPSAACAPKKRGKAAKVVNDGEDVANADMAKDNADGKPAAKKKRAPKKKPSATETNGVNGVNGDDGGHSGSGASDEATTPTKENGASPSSPKRKIAVDEDGSPKKKVRETKIKSEEFVKEEEEEEEKLKSVSEAGCSAFNTEALQQNEDNGDVEKDGEGHNVNLKNQDKGDVNVIKVKQEVETAA